MIKEVSNAVSDFWKSTGPLYVEFWRDKKVNPVVKIVVTPISIIKDLGLTGVLIFGYPICKIGEHFSKR